MNRIRFQDSRFTVRSLTAFALCAALLLFGTTSNLHAQSAPAKEVPPAVQKDKPQEVAPQEKPKQQEKAVPAKPKTETPQGKSDNPQKADAKPAAGKDDSAKDKTPKAHAEKNPGDQADSPKAKDPAEKKDAESAKPKIDKAPAPQEKSKADGKSDEKSSNQSTSKPQRRGINKESRQLLSVFRPVAAAASKATVEVLSGKRRIAMGTIVDENGYILTKASELRGNISCKLYDGRTLSATIHGINNETDLAMLKVESGNLQTVTWSPTNVPQVGSWLITPGLDKDPVAIGVVSVRPREIKPAKGFFGVQLDLKPNEKGVRVVRVVADAPAEAAGVMVNDFITKVNDVPAPSRERSWSR